MKFAAALLLLGTIVSSALAGYMYDGYGGLRRSVIEQRNSINLSELRALKQNIQDAQALKQVATRRKLELDFARRSLKEEAKQAPNPIAASQALQAADTVTKELQQVKEVIKTVTTQKRQMEQVKDKLKEAVLRKQLVPQSEPSYTDLRSSMPSVFHQSNSIG